MKLLFPIAFLLLAPALAAQEWPVTPAVPTEGAFTQDPAAATSGDLTLVVWNDLRAFGDVYAARVDGSGHVLDPNGIYIAHGRALAAVTAMASGNFLIALAGQAPCGAIDTVKVSRAGAMSKPQRVSDTSPRCVNSLQLATIGQSILLLMDGDHYLLFDGFGNVASPEVALSDRPTFGAVASNGRGYLIAVGGTSPPVSRPGSIQVVAFPAEGVSAFALASNGAGYMLATLTSSHLELQPLTSDGKPAGPARTALLTGVPSAVRLTFDGSSYVAAWTQDDPSMLYTGRVTGTGELYDTAAIGTGLPAFALTYAALVRIDSSKLLMRPFGGVDTNVVMAPSGQMPPLMAGMPNGAALLWTEFSPPALRAATLDGKGRPSGKNVVIRPGFADGYFLDFDGTDLVVAWLEGRKLFARRYTTSLDPVDAAPIAIATDAGTPSIAAGGGTALLLWESGGAILSRSGVVVPVAGPNHSGFTAAAWNGSEYLVAYTDIVSASEWFIHQNIRAFRVASDGAVLDAVPATLARLDTGLRWITVARNGRGFLVAWLTPDNGAAVTAKFVAADGTTDASDPQALSPPDVIGRFFLAPYGDTTIVSWGSQPVAGEVLVQWRFVGGGAQALPLMHGSPLPVPALATIGPRIVISYQRIDDEAGGVPRIFVRSVYAPRVRSAR